MESGPEDHGGLSEAEEVRQEKYEGGAWGRRATVEVPPLFDFAGCGMILSSLLEGELQCLTSM
jgi:hypothetical protein